MIKLQITVKFIKFSVKYSNIVPIVGRHKIEYLLLKPEKIVYGIVMRFDCKLISRRKQNNNNIINLFPKKTKCEKSCVDVLRCTNNERKRAKKKKKHIILFLHSHTQQHHGEFLKT